MKPKSFATTDLTQGLMELAVADPRLGQIAALLESWASTNNPPTSPVVGGEESAMSTTEEKVERDMFGVINEDGSSLRRRQADDTFPTFAEAVAEAADMLTWGTRKVAIVSIDWQDGVPLAKATLAVLEATDALDDALDNASE